MKANSEDRAMAGELPLQIAVQIRNAKAATHWHRYNSQLVLNFGLLAAVMIRRSDPFIAAHLHLITIIGAELSVIWFLFSAQSKKNLTYWENYLRTYDLLEGFATKAGQSWLTRNWRNLNIFAWALPTLCFLCWCLLFATKKLD